MRMRLRCFAQRQIDTKVAALAARFEPPADNFKPSFSPAVALIRKCNNVANLDAERLKPKVSRKRHLFASAEQCQFGKPLRCALAGCQRKLQIKRVLDVVVFGLKGGAFNRREINCDVTTSLSANVPTTRLKLSRAPTRVSRLIGPRRSSSVNVLTGGRIIANVQLPLALTPEQSATAGRHHARHNFTRWHV